MHEIVKKKMDVKILRHITVLAALYVVVTLTGCTSCSSDSATAGDNLPPTVISTSILNNAVDISEATNSLTADFSEPMDASTLTPLTFTLSGPNGIIPATVSYIDNTASMNIPSGSLDYSTVYIARISTAAKDVAGNSLDVDYELRFSTVKKPDGVAPRISSTNPPNDATGVAIDRAINAIFSEPLDCTTVDISSFLINGGAAGNVSCSGSIATFTLTTPFADSTTYTATLKSAIKDLTGNALAADYIWSFTTGTEADTSAPQVLSTNPQDKSTGVTVNSAINAIFSEPLNCSTVDTTSFVLSGPSGPIDGNTDCYGDIAFFTPSSNLEFDTVYTATITSEVQDLSKNAIASSYSWSFNTGTAADTRAPNVISTSPVINATGIDINDNVSVVFSEAMDPASISFSLIGPSGNVNGTVAYSGTTATFTLANSLVPNTTYTATITTAAQDLAGNAMLANYGWDFTTAIAADTTAPTVISTSPANGERIAINSLFKAVFSEPLDCATVDNTSFKLNNGTVNGNVSCNSNTVTFIPSNILAYSTNYTATISTAITDKEGNPLSSVYSWMVSTNVDTTPDTTAPTVVSISPINNATDVAITTTISAVFDEALDCATVNDANFLVNDGAAVIGTVSCSENTATFVPNASLSNNTIHAVSVTTGMKDLAGNALAANVDWSFTTIVGADSTAPTVISTTPVNGAANIAVDSNITAVFSELLNCATITTGSFSLDGAIGTVSCLNGTATLTPNSNLAYNTTYTATLTTFVEDPIGNNLFADNTWSFTTIAAPDVTGPTVSSTVPVNSSVNIATETIPTVIFDEALDCSTVNDISFTLSGTTSGSVVGNVSCSGNSASFTPSTNLKFGEVYTASLTTSITDLIGNPMTASDWSFTTLSLPWIKQFGSSNYDDIHAIAVDQSTGVVYVAGTSLGGIDGNTNSGGWDVFLTQYSAAGTKMWTEQLGTLTDDNIQDIAIDNSGNVYLAGYSGASLVDNTVSTTIDSFLIKYDSNGSVQWIKSIATSFNDKAHGVVIDSSDNIYVAGFTYGDLLNGAINSGADLFLIKYDSTGSEIWKRQFGNSTDDLFISGMGIDTNNNIYLSGSTFGTFAVNPTTGGEDALLIKYDANGNRQWIRQYGGGSDNKATAVAVDLNSIYVAGKTQDSFGTSDVHLAKFDISTGSPDGTSQIGNSGVDDVAYDIAVVDSSNIYVTGFTAGGLAGNSNSGGQDVILVKFDSNLNDIWARQLGTGANDIGYGVASDSLGNIFVGGYTLGTLEHNINSGLSDAFVVKYNASGIRQ